MATTKQVILGRVKMEINNIKTVGDTKRVLKLMADELAEEHKNSRNDVIAAESRLTAGGL